MAITSIGFAGSVGAVEFAQLAVHQGALYPVVCGKDDLAVTANPGGTLTCNVAPGASAGQGVKTTSTATEAVTFSAVVTPGQTRWDAVVLRRSWASTGSAALVVVPGTAGAGAPMVLPAGVDDSLNSTHDHVLALVQITYGNTVPTQVIDRRLQGSKVFTAPALTALPPASAALYGMEAALPTGDRYRCRSDSGGSPAWVSDVRNQKGTTAAITLAAGAASTVQTTAFPTAFFAVPQVMLTAVSPYWGVAISSVSTTGFTWRARNNGGASETAAVRWLAVA